MADAPKSVMNPNGLSDAECQEIHGYFVKGTQLFIAVGFVAHLLVWAWMPWYPG